MSPRVPGPGESAASAIREVSVLVVDDDADIRDTVRTILETEGYSVADATDGLAALALLERVRPRLILLDLTMPAMDGVAFRERQLSDESLAAIPTIVVTARGSHGKEAAPLLARACLPKPLELDKLLELVHHYCDPPVTN